MLNICWWSSNKLAYFQVNCFSHHQEEVYKQEESKQYVYTVSLYQFTPTHLEPTGISRSDGKWPDGATIVPRKGVRVLVWDATCPDTLAPSHITLGTREAGAVADEAERRKKQKYSSLMTSHHFVPIAIEMSGVFGSEAITFFKELGQRTKFKPRSFHF